MVKAYERRNKVKKYLKSELCVAMKNLEEKKEIQKVNEAKIDELHKVGPPMMQEIEHNQKKLLEETAKINQMQGDENYVLMLSARRQAKQQQMDDLDEYHAKFSEDLMSRLNKRGIQQDKARKNYMTKRAAFKEAAASKSPDGRNIQFVKPLEQLEMQDYVVAKAVTDARQAEEDQKQARDAQLVQEQLKATQMQNYAHVINKHSLSVREKRNNLINNEGKYYASIKVPDLVDPIDLDLERKVKGMVNRGNLNDQVD